MYNDQNASGAAFLWQETNSIKPDADGIFRSEVLDGFWIRVEWLWHQPLHEAMKALGLP